MKKVILSIFILVFAFILTGCNAPATTGTSQSSTQSDTNAKKQKVEYSMNQDIFINKPTGEYRFKITGIRETSERNEFSETVANKVIIISYEYENISLDDDLYISEMDFKVYDSQGNKLETYPIYTKYPGSVSTGRKDTGEVAYALNSSDNYVELEYYSNLWNSKSDCLIKLQW